MCRVWAIFRVRVIFHGMVRPQLVKTILEGINTRSTYCTTLSVNEFQTFTSLEVKKSLRGACNHRIGLDRTGAEVITGSDLNFNWYMNFMLLFSNI